MDDKQRPFAPSPETQEHARRNARYTYAERRIRKILDGTPPLTPEQLERLALLLRTGTAAGNAA